MKYAVETASRGMICTDVQAILRFYLRNLRGCNVGITSGMDLLRTSLGWA
jgi:hypothetical protein